MKLVPASHEWKDPFLEMAQEWTSIEPERYALALSDFAAYPHRIESEAPGKTLPEGRVHGAQYWLEDAGRIVACGRLRFWLNAELSEEGGHIGYDVRPSLRRRGYGRAVLRHTLIEARRRGLSRVLLTTDADNVGSQRIIEAAGGKLAATAVSKRSGRPILQYWIEEST